ncbi:hypothetical protein DENIS_3014 [Desulfonema ishimotonii]|uniref:Sodium/calcium exchanger membrane region domain-containing protein n=1 Tax=Desulfonema ishimotonii TaxID=45657 RepID=A0A401FYK7_9BACT|nr:calcium/sodium antiporter [Desulfonema ishimotonii]GBC62051.1 hypothetical protein DENIS_3014 [Desulfonema ishimotonii]
MTALISLCVMIVAIYILSVITDEFFITSLDRIAVRWKMPPSVAGASLMAVGSSAPELSIALFSLFREGGAHSDVGIGTIVGSAVFNILVITGVSAIIREARITLPAVVRDTVFYLGSILVLMIVFWDGTITAQECLIFLSLYLMYLAFLFFIPMGTEPEAAPDEADDDESDETEKSQAGGNPDGGGRLRQINTAIVRAVSRLTGDAEVTYMRTFGVSILFIIGLSWILVDTAVIFADAVGIPPLVVALTLLAGGTSAPDLISSVVVARQGRGSMAVANAIGSNIFDILVGLGLPWLLAILFMGKTAIEVGTGDLMLSVLILMSTVVVLFVFLYTDRLLSKKEGWGLVGLYGLYVIWTVLAG